jgi:hypothetical protein
VIERTEFEYSAHNAQSRRVRTTHDVELHNSGMDATKRARGSAIDMPDWWCKLARPLILGPEDKPRNSTELSIFGIRLAEKIGRNNPFDRGHLKNTALGDRLYTIELVDALQRTFPTLPRAFFVARDQHESTEMAAVQHNHDHKHTRALDEKRAERAKAQADDDHATRAQAAAASATRAAEAAAAYGTKRARRR